MKRSLSIARATALFGGSAFFLIVTGHAHLPGEHDDLTSVTLDTMVISASLRDEAAADMPSTVQVFGSHLLEHSSASSITEFLSEHAVGFFSQWTPAQTSVNIRGAATDGQGKDFNSRVLVLVNGRRAGTANLSKLSLADVARIEIIRGPSSVLHGSQALGGVINLITRRGENTEGNRLTATAGSWDRYEGTLWISGDDGTFDYYVGLHAGKRGDYKSGKGSPERMFNTSYERAGGLVSMGYHLTPTNRIEATIRSGGIYNAGFRGSSSRIGEEAWEDKRRENQSLDLIYTGQGPWLTSELTSQFYAFKDTDDFRWLPNFNNFRQLHGFGVKNFMTYPLSDTNELLVGFDLEHSRLRTERIDGGGQVLQPFDNNFNTVDFGVYAEDVQRVFDERLGLRAGLRYDHGRVEVKETPGRPGIEESTNTFDSLTFSTGAAWHASERWTLRASIGSGFRAPSGSELATGFVTTGSPPSQQLGNPGLDPEKSLGGEVGITYERREWRSDVALFQNRIRDFITFRPIGDDPDTGQPRSRLTNTDKATITGLESFNQVEFGELFGLDYRLALFANAVYHFEFETDEPGPAPNSNKIERMYRYQGSVGTIFGHGRWSTRFSGILRGPMHYNTEEPLRISDFRPQRQWMMRKSPFWVFNARFEFQANDNLMLWAGVNNIFDRNQHPVFVALNEEPSKYPDSVVNNPNRGFGNSMPGREFLLGLEWFF